MDDLIPTIGLEVHAELKTQTKMFCSSKNDANESSPNRNICPVCLAHPGTLPVINKKAVHSVLRVGTAIGGKIADYTEFDRKNYFYPDLPKGYQISQYEFPLISGGTLNGVAITRIHLEEDTASSIHDEVSGETRIDYNRAGVPLMELVTEPVIRSGKEAGDFGRELQTLLRYLGVSDANMEKGEMRLEANISVGKNGILGTKVEVKNINSFGIMERAVAYEIERQKALIARGEQVVQETRGWNDAKQETFSQRVKEGSADYRYFPDPDLPSLKLSEVPEFAVDALKATLPELPSARRDRYIGWGVKPIDAAQFVSAQHLGNFFDEIAAKNSDREYIKRAANYISNDLVSIIRDIESRDTVSVDFIPISSERFSKIMVLIGEGKLTSRAAKDLLALCITSEGDPENLAKEKGLLTDTSLDIGAVVDDIIAKNPTVVTDYKGGKAAAMQFLVGQGMKALKGSVDPVKMKSLLEEKLGA